MMSTGSVGRRGLRARGGPVRNRGAVAAAAVCGVVAIASCSGSASREDPPHSEARGTPTTELSPNQPSPSAPAGPPAPEWGPPELVARGQHPGDGFFAGEVAVLGQWAVASWEVDEGFRFALRPGRGQWVVQPLIPDAWPSAVAVGPQGTALVTWLGPRNAVSNGRGSLFERHRVDGRWSPPARLGNAGLVDAVIDRWGAMTVARASDREVTVVSRPARRSWGEVARFPANSYVQNLVLTANNRGDLLLGWEVGGGVRTAFRARGGEWTLGPILRSAIAYVVDLEVSLDDEGRALVMWGLDPEWEELEKKYLAWAASGPDGTWTRTSYLDERAKPAVWGVGDIALSVNSSGHVLAAWSSDENNGYTSHAARFDVETGWASIDDLGTFGASEALLTDSGAAVVAFAPTGGSQQSWWYQHPGGEWQRGKVQVEGPTSFHGSDQQMAMLDVSSEVVTRFLVVE